MRVPRAYCISGHNRKAAAFTSSEAITTYSIVLLHVYWAQVEADFLEGRLKYNALPTNDRDGTNSCRHYAMIRRLTRGRICRYAKAHFMAAP